MQAQWHQLPCSNSEMILCRKSASGKNPATEKHKQFGRMKIKLIGTKLKLI